ncbi:hypothetical protein D3C81_2135170 [compost metagenome]
MLADASMPTTRHMRSMSPASACDLIGSPSSSRVAQLPSTTPSGTATTARHMNGQRRGRSFHQISTRGTSIKIQIDRPISWL